MKQPGCPTQHYISGMYGPITPCIQVQCQLFDLYWIIWHVSVRSKQSTPPIPCIIKNVNNFRLVNFYFFGHLKTSLPFVAVGLMCSRRLTSMSTNIRDFSFSFQNKIKNCEVPFRNIFTFKKKKNSLTRFELLVAAISLSASKRSSGCFRGGY